MGIKMRIILYTGKGGVGKTSIAAATACQIAKQDKKVLIMSTDQAHSLGDSFGCTILKEPTYVTENLYGLEIDTVEENEKAWGKIKEYLKKLLTAQSGNSIEVEELLVFPGMDELFSLLKVKELYDQQEYDVMIVDCAPTGETMSLLKFPEVIQWWMEHLFPLKKQFTHSVGPLVEKTTKIPMPKEETFNEVEYLYHKIVELRTLLSNKKEVSVRIVTTPEKIVIKEAKRSFSFLHLFDFNVDAIIVNKIYPQIAMEGYFRKWLEAQSNSLRELEENFYDIPQFHQELLSNELRSLERLEGVAEQLYGEKNPMDILYEKQIFMLEKQPEGDVLKIYLPFLKKEELQLVQEGEELHISVKNEKRNLVLPKKLITKQIKRAKYEDEVLAILFV